LFERPRGGERAVLVQLDFGHGNPAADLAELKELARSAGADARAVVTGRRQRPDAAFYAGTGKVEEIERECRETGAELVIFNHALSGAQERNLERALSARVVDRVTLILDIFALRAKSAEGKLQVELAQVKHQLTRLVGGWSHLERQKGGIGLRGPGETQLETDRRLLNQRIRVLKERIAKVATQRQTQRRARLRSDVRNVALVGYTNAGKSTLFNRLTGERVYAANQLFATLDTTLRRLPLDAGPRGNGGAKRGRHGDRGDRSEPHSDEAGDVVTSEDGHAYRKPLSIVLSDTVGFIRDLPHGLIAAFRATLQEAVDADLLLHVIDASHPESDAQIDAVNGVLEEIGAGAVPRVHVLNKCDRTGLAPGVERDEYGKIRTIRLSALTGAGCDAVPRLLAETFAPDASAPTELPASVSTHTTAPCP
jgi:GTP-binding protein HflX